jgi:two-component system response regulator AtoC
VRVIAATNRDIKVSIAQKSFREDLYYRLNVYPIRIPPLRDRRGDLLPLVHYFLEHFSQRFRRATPAFSPEARERLLAYSWPGNVREVRNLMERLAITSRGAVISVEDLPDEIRGASPVAGPHWILPPEGVSLETLELELARSLISQALERTGRNVTQASKLLNLPRGTLRHRMESLGIRGDDTT